MFTEDYAPLNTVSGSDSFKPINKLTNMHLYKWNRSHYLLFGILGMRDSMFRLLDRQVFLFQQVNSQCYSYISPVHHKSYW